MVRTGDEYRESLRDGREVWIDGESVADVPSHPMFRPLVDVRARIYDMQHDPATSETMTWRDEASGETCAIGLKLPLTREDWERKRRAVDAVMWDIGGVVTRVGDETIGEMWSLWDGKSLLNEIDPRFGDNIERHIHEAVRRDPFHVSANTDPKGDRSKRPQEQDPDMLVHVVRETDAGIVIRGAKYETAAAYAEQAFLKPTIANWGDDKLSDYAVGCIVRMNAPGVKHLCRTGFAGRAPARDYPLSNRFDEVDSLVVLDDVLIPWEGRALLPAHAGRHVHPGHPAPLLRVRLRAADSHLCRHDDRGGPVEREADRARAPARGAGEARGARGLPGRDQRPPDCRGRRRGGEPERAPHAQPVAPLHRPGARLRQPARDDAPRSGALRRPDLHHPGHGNVRAPDTGPWLAKFYTINERWQAEDRRKLLAFARDLLNSDYAGHRLTFQLFAQSPPFAHLAAVYRNFDWDGPLDFVRRSAGLSDRVTGGDGSPGG